MYSRTALLLLLLAGIAPAFQTLWEADMKVGKAAFGAGKYAEAADAFAGALGKAEEGKAGPVDLYPILQSLASAQRATGNAADASETLLKLVRAASDAYGGQSVEVASSLAGLADAQRALDLRKEALASLEQAIQIRTPSGISAELARDHTSVAALHQEMGDDAAASSAYQTALALWGALPNSGLQILTAIDPLIAIYRDKGAYADAEVLCLWALRLREAALGPKHTELIATLDALAYVLFGQKKYAEAEPVYQRLLALWEMSAGAEHPMTALTLDKMVEFYSAQGSYDKADPLVRRAAAIRTRSAMESLHRMGRVLVGEQKFEEALDLYARAIRIGENTQTADEFMDGVLRAYSMLLRQAKREDEAKIIDRRVTDALIRKADRDGTRRPKPTPAKSQSP